MSRGDEVRTTAHNVLHGGLRAENQCAIKIAASGLSHPIVRRRTPTSKRSTSPAAAHTYRKGVPYDTPAHMMQSRRFMLLFEVHRLINERAEPRIEAVFAILVAVSEALRAALVPTGVDHAAGPVSRAG